MVSTDDSAKQEEPWRPPYLQVAHASGRITKFSLKEGESVFAGSGSTCRILLQDGDVAQFHCMFSLNEGRLWAQDCGTGGETAVNGTPLTGEIVLAAGDQIAIEGYRIVPILKLDEELVPAVTTPPACPDQAEIVDISSEELDHVSSDASEEPDWPSDSDFSDDERFEDVWSDPTDDEPFDSAVSQELELLRSEVEYLLSELAMRDARGEESRDIPATEFQSSPESHENEVLRLVNRLEELLAELQTSDERVRNLDNLLRASDEANQAEQEERRQLESWLSEIEFRVSQRESEMDAEVEKLRQRCQSADRQRLHAESQIKKLASAGSKQATDSAADVRQTRELQAQLDQQNRSLESIQQENAELKIQLQDLRQRDNTEEMAALEQKLAQMELETSRERAELARQRSEFENLRSEFERKLQHKTEPAADQTRIVAMRQHLREIHEEEKSREMERKQNSLSGRISRLLNRV